MRLKGSKNGRTDSEAFLTPPNTPKKAAPSISLHRDPESGQNNSLPSTSLFVELNVHKNGLPANCRESNNEDGNTLFAPEGIAVYIRPVSLVVLNFDISKSDASCKVVLH